MNRNINNVICVVISFYDNENHRYENEFIQGILKGIDAEDNTLTIEQKVPYKDFVLGGEYESFTRVVKNGEFSIIGNLREN